jgi:hypothetical protein
MPWARHVPLDGTPCCRECVETARLFEMKRSYLYGLFGSLLAGAIGMLLWIIVAAAYTPGASQHQQIFSRHLAILIVTTALSACALLGARHAPPNENGRWATFGAVLGLFTGVSVVGCFAFVMIVIAISLEGF